MCAPPPGVAAGGADRGNARAIRIRNSVFTAADKPAGVIENSVLSSSAHTTPLVLDNAIVDLPIYCYHNTTQGNQILAYPGSTNVVSCEFFSSGYQANAAAGAGAVLEFRGGVGSGNCFRFLGPGEIRIVDKPFDIDNGSYTEGSGKLVLDAENCITTGNSAREGFTHAYGALEFRRSWCFNSESMQFTISSGRTLTVEFNATTQRVGIARFYNTTAGSVLHGDYPAMLETTGFVRTGAEAKYVYNPTNTIQVTGGLGFHACGEGTVFPLAAKAFESCGDLEASAGTLELKANATWLNGTNFTARGMGTLKFAAAGQVNRDHAQLHFGEVGGSVYVPEGVKMHFIAADVAGVAVPSGSYSATSGGVISGRITGGGSVRIGIGGTAILLR